VASHFRDDFFGCLPVRGDTRLRSSVTCVNVFSGAGQELELTNGGTQVFVEVLTLAVSDLVQEPWDYRFAGLLTQQDQSVRGRGFVGFELEEIDWGHDDAQQARNKEFVLRVIDLALLRHRWDELPYDPPFAQRYLQQFKSMVEAFPPATAMPDPGFPGFPEPDDAAMASCALHRVLSALPHWDSCILCSR